MIKYGTLNKGWIEESILGNWEVRESNRGIAEEDGQN